MFLVPYIPTPLPDEILGSWLARISFHNSKGTWSALLKYCGFTDGKLKPFFDLIDHDENTEKLFAILGISYERVLNELTTLPYWLTFVANSDSTLLAGTKATKAPLNVRGKKIDKVSLLGLRRRVGRPTSPAFCVQCLNEDHEKHGQAYWHRSHQLPNVYFCDKHECELHDRCPQCGKRALAPLRSLMPLPELKCDCGCQFATIALNGTVNKAHLDFSKLSAAALRVADPSWSRDDVIIQFKRWFKGDLKNQHQSYIALLDSTFGSIPDPLAPASELKVSTAMTDQRALCFRENPSTSSAPDFCALLVGMGKNLENAISGFRSINEERKNCVPKNVRSRKPYEKKSVALKQPNFLRERIRIERALSLTKAFHEILHCSDIPKTITSEKLGNIAGLSIEQASTVIGSHEFLRESIKKANSDLSERKIMWAASSLRSSGEKLTKSAIWKMAQLDKRSDAKKLWNSFSILDGKLKFDNESDF